MKSSLSNFVDFWPIITSIFVVTFMAGSIINTQQAHAGKIEKLESIREDINQIKIKIERIDTTLEQLNQRK
jgi:hypothetical protein